MQLKSAIKVVNNRIRSEYMEPAWGWGIRVAISVTIPLIYGWIYGDALGAEWMAIAAECVSFIELKGNIGQRVRLLLSSFGLCILFCLAGSFAGNFMLINLTGMLCVGFLCGIFKNLGDRGVGLTLSIYIFYIITSAYPVHTTAELVERCSWVALGTAWAILVGIVSFLFLKSGTPYRRTIAAIWKSLASLAVAAGKGWDGQQAKSNIRDIYLKEKEIRSTIDASLYLFEETSDQVQKDQKNKYALTQSRKAASLVSLHLIQLSETAEAVYRKTSNRQLNIQIHALFRSIEMTGARMEIYLLSLREEEKIIVISRIGRMRKVMQMIMEMSEEIAMEAEVNKMSVLVERICKLVEHSMTLLEQPGETRIYASYSLMQTLAILHPKYLKQNLRQLLNPDSQTTRYALRIGIATMIGAVIAYVFFTDSSVIQQSDNRVVSRLSPYFTGHGYWVPFTAIIVSQPYFGATLKKGVQRSLGTIAGIIVGTLILSLPFPSITRIVLVFLSSIFMIYFLKRQYSIATFFITLLLVGLLTFEPHFNPDLMITRVTCTIIGSILAIVAGFILLPAWDKDLLPKYLAEAITQNFYYFQHTFYRDAPAVSWTKLKRLSESRNGNAFESFTRFIQEPVHFTKKGYATYYMLLTHNIRITRELNNFHSEIEMNEQSIPIREKEQFFRLLYECDDLFRDNAALLKKSGNHFIEDKYLKSFPEEGFTNTEPNETQVFHIEKLLLELKALHVGLTTRQSRFAQ